MKEKRDRIGLGTEEEPERDKTSKRVRTVGRLCRESVNGTKKKGIGEAGARGRATRAASNLQSMSE